MTMRLAIGVMIGVAVSGAAGVAQKPAETKTFATYQLPEAKRVTLPNGLVLLLLEKHELPLTSVEIELRTGSLLDPDAKPGVSAVVANELRKGTATRTAEQLSSDLDFMGMEFSAGSGTESTGISGDFLSKDSDRALGLMADMVLHPVFPADELKKTIAKRQEALKTDKDNVQYAVRQYYRATLFAGHPYAHELTTTEASLGSITREDVVRFHDRVYTPANAVIAVVGDFDSAKMEATLRELFGGWKGVAPAAVKVPVMKPVTGKNVLLVDKPDATQTYFIVGNVGLSETDPDRAPVEVVNTLYGGRFTSLFNEELRIKSGYSYGAASYFQEYRTPGPFEMASYTKNATTAQAIDKTFEVIGTLHTHPFTDADLTSVKNYIRGTFPPSLETSPALANRLVTDEVEGISRERFNAELAEEQATTLAEANRVIDKDFPTRDNYVLVIVGKASEIGGLAAKYGTVTQRKISDPGY
jgi:zinc protease